MPDLTLTLPVFVNLDPNAEVLCRSSNDQRGIGRLRVVSGDERTVSLRLHQTQSDGTWSRVGLPTGWNMVLSAKLAAGDDTAYFTTTGWVASGSGTTLAYAATMDFAVSDATWGDPAEPMRVFRADLEIRDATNAVRGTWQFEIELHRENYGSGDTPDDPDEPFLDRPTADNIYVSFAAAQTLTSPQKTQALDNLGGTTVGKAVFAAADAAAARTAIGAGTGYGDLVDAGSITVGNAGKVAVVTADKTLGAGVAYTDAATASTIMSRDASGNTAVGVLTASEIQTAGAITRGKIEDSGLTLRNTVGTVSFSVDSDSGFVRVFNLSGAGGLQEWEDGAFGVVATLANDGTFSAVNLSAGAFVISPSLKASSSGGATIKTENGSTVATWGISNANTMVFNGASWHGDNSETGLGVHIDTDGAYGQDSGDNLTWEIDNATGYGKFASLRALSASGSTIDTASGTTAVTWGVSNSTTVTFAGTIEGATIKAPTSAGGTIQSSNGTTCASWGAGGGGNFSVASLTIGSHSISLAGSLTTSGAFGLTLTTTGTTNITLPTSGRIPSSSSIWQNVRDFHRRVVYFNGGNMTGAVTGTGTTATAGMLGRILNGPTTGTGAGTARMRSFGSSQVDQAWNIMADTNAGTSAAFDFSQEICVWGSAYFTVVNDNSFTFRITIGKLEADGIGDLASGRAGYQIKFNSGTSANLQLLVGSGSGAATATTSTFAPTANTRFEWEIYKAAGSNTVTLYVNGVAVATNTNAGTTTVTSSTFVLYQEELESSGSAASFTRMIASRGGMYGSEL